MCCRHFFDKFRAGFICIDAVNGTCKERVASLIFFDDLDRCFIRPVYLQVQLQCIGIISKADILAVRQL